MVVQKKPLVSILIPTFEREDTIADTLSSAVAQTYSNIEIIVCDNNSKDASEKIILEFVNQYSNVFYYKNSENIGPVNNWKKTFQLSHGEYIKFLWSDDKLEPDHIRKMLGPLLESNYAFSVCKAILTSRDNKVYYKYKKDFDIYLFDIVTSLPLRVPHLPYSPSAGLIRREYVEKAFNLLMDDECTKKAIGPDLLILYNSLIFGEKGRYVSNTYVFFVAGRGSISFNTDKKKLYTCYFEAGKSLLKNTKYYSFFIKLKIFSDKITFYDKYKIERDVLPKFSPNMSSTRFIWLLFKAVFIEMFRRVL